MVLNVKSCDSTCEFSQLYKSTALVYSLSLQSLELLHSWLNLSKGASDHQFSDHAFLDAKPGAICSSSAVYQELKEEGRAALAWPELAFKLI